MGEIVYQEGTKVQLLRTFQDDFYHITDPRFTDEAGMYREGYLHRVSHVLGEVVTGHALDQWKGEQIAQKGIEGARFDMISRMEVGTNVHHLVQNYLRGVPTGVFRDRSGEVKERKQWTDREWLLFAKWVNWFLSAPTEVIATEFTVWSWDMKVAGTLDAILKRDEVYQVEVQDGEYKSGPRKGEPKFVKTDTVSSKTRVYDWKSSKGVFGTHLIQCSTYWKCVKEMFTEIELDGAAVLALGSPNVSGPQLKTIDNADCERLVKVFERRKAVFDDEHPEYTPNIIELPLEFIPTHKAPTLEVEAIEEPPEFDLQ